MGANNGLLLKVHNQINGTIHYTRDHQEKGVRGSRMEPTDNDGGGEERGDELVRMRGELRGLPWSERN